MDRELQSHDSEHPSRGRIGLPREVGQRSSTEPEEEYEGETDTPTGHSFRCCGGSDRTRLRDRRHIPSGTPYTSTIKAASEGTTTLHNSSLGVSVSCKKSTVEGKVESHGTGVTVKGNVSSLTFGECGADTVTVLKTGSLEIHEGQGGNHIDGTLTSVGAEITIKNGATGVSCTYTTGTGTDIRHPYRQRHHR